MMKQRRKKQLEGGEPFEAAKRDVKSQFQNYKD